MATTSSSLAAHKMRAVAVKAMADTIKVGACAYDRSRFVGRTFDALDAAEATGVDRVAFLRHKINCAKTQIAAGAWYAPSVNYLIALRQAYVAERLARFAERAASRRYTARAA